jgi:hypothetical protein
MGTYGARDFVCRLYEAGCILKREGARHPCLRGESLLNFFPKKSPASKRRGRGERFIDDDRIGE